MSFRPRFTFANERYHPPFSNINPPVNRPFMNEANQVNRLAVPQNYSSMHNIKNTSFFSSNPPPTFNPIPPPTHCFSSMGVSHTNTSVPSQQPFSSIYSEPYKSHSSRLPISNFQFSSTIPSNSQSHPSQSAAGNSFVNNVGPINSNSSNTNFNSVSNSSVQNSPYPVSNLPPTPNQIYSNIPCTNTNITSYPFPPPSSAPTHQNFNVASSSVNNLVKLPGNMINMALNPPNINNSATATTLTNLTQVPSTNFQSACMTQAPPPIIKSGGLGHFNLSDQSYSLKKDDCTKLSEFLNKFSISEKRKGNQTSVPEFRCALKSAICIMKYLCEKKDKLKNCLNANENEWTSEMQSITDLKEELSTLCSFISAPSYLNSLLKKLQSIKKRREQKKKTKQNKFSMEIKAEQNRKELSLKIDKWLDDIKEKNLKLKRELEMKKEADFILLEVRRKIHEANKTLEKIKVFEKLRHARQANAVNKGLHVPSEHSEKFEKKATILKETMLKQLKDYEAEEKALKVMLETEQEGQLEEEAQWKIKKAKTLQQKRQKHIKECLFGISDDPLPSDPLYLFHKFHTAASSSIESLIQIRHQWDVYLAKDGEVVPRQWVVPSTPSSHSWDQHLITKS